jgi:signal transduction histidine kinase
MQAIGQLAGGIAHDFNNLLGVINGYAELIAEDLGPSHRSQRDLDEIRAAARSATNLIRQLLAFSRRQILQPQILDLNAVLRRSQRLLGRVIGEHITLTMNLSARSRVNADPGQIEQVMMNLAVNATPARRPGSPTARIGTTITCSGPLFDPLRTHLDILGESAYPHLACLVVPIPAVLSSCRVRSIC